MNMNAIFKQQIIEASVEFWINYNYTHPYEDPWLDEDGLL